MGRFDTIKTTIDANIKENGSQEITGQKMNSVLTEMVNATDAELTELESETIQLEGGLNILGKYYNNSGVLTSHPTIRCSELLPIQEDSVVFLFNSSGGEKYGNFAFFDENKQHISSVFYSTRPLAELYLTKVDFPENAKYIAVNGDNTEQYQPPFVIISSIVKNFDYNNIKDRLLDSLIWTDGGTATKSYISNLIPVVDGLTLTSGQPDKTFFRIILFDQEGKKLYNEDISFSDGEAKGEGGELGRFSGRIYTIPKGYNIAYVKIQYLEENGKPTIFAQFSPNKLLERIDQNQSQSPWKGKKVVTIGDSLTENCVWQPFLAKYKDLIWSSEETKNGVGYVNIADGTYTLEDKSNDSAYRKAYPMAVGGTAMRPGSDQSIYIRALDAVHYNPDIILLYGGENDGISMVTGNNPWGDTSLSAKDLVEQTPAYTDGVISYETNAMAAYKGLIELLSAKCPKAKIYLVAPMRCRCEIGMTSTGGAFEGTIRFKSMSDVLDYDNKDRLKRWGYIKALGEYYGLPVIDLMNNCGATHYNEKEWYGHPVYDCTQVHPNDYGYMMMAKCMATYL